MVQKNGLVKDNIVLVIQVTIGGKFEKKTGKIWRKKIEKIWGKLGEIQKKIGITRGTFG